MHRGHNCFVWKCNSCTASSTASRLHAIHMHCELKCCLPRASDDQHKGQRAFQDTDVNNDALMHSVCALGAGGQGLACFKAPYPHDCPTT
eukprot:774217-Pelagomonas_calceolata.AAC.5